MNSRNGTSVNGRLLRPDEEYQLEPEDERRSTGKIYISGINVFTKYRRSATISNGTLFLR